MKERPIIFSAPMVRAILEGKKTQMRRVVKRQGDMEFDCADPHFGPYWLPYATEADGEDAKVRCPYGEPGDRLWVQETAWQGRGATWGSHCFVYDADKAISWTPGSGFDNPDMRQFKKRPAIFMPRWASRITLEIVGIRTERLQEISCEDALAEGVLEWVQWDSPEAKASWAGSRGYAQGAFPRLWQSIHGDGSWDANPWVWVINFRRLQ